MKYQKGFTLVELIFAGVLCLGIWGWIWNIVKIIAVLSTDGMTLGTIPAFILFRCLGVPVAPLGAILGYF